MLDQHHSLMRSCSATQIGRLVLRAVVVLNYLLSVCLLHEVEYIVVLLRRRVHSTQ